jgi:FkbM family methyltransferase
MNYTNSIYDNFINRDKIKVIFEVGSRDGLDAISLSKKYPESKVYSFECNPLTIDICKNNINNSLQKNIHFYDFALGKENGTFPFYPYVKCRNTIHELESLGSSSFFKRSDFNETQEYIKDVNVVKVYDFCLDNNIHKIDLLCMDVQGYELNILKGCESMIQYIDYIILETTKSNKKSVYNYSPTYEDINNFMNISGFRQRLVIPENDVEDNILYTR